MWPDIDVFVGPQTDLEDQATELKSAEEQAKKAMVDAARLADELRQEQEHSSHIEKARRAIESQVRLWHTAHIVGGTCTTAHLAYLWSYIFLTSLVSIDI